MKRIIFSIALAYICSHAHAQFLNNTDAFQKQIAAKANTLCRYIVAVGTSPGQPGSVGSAEKDNIILNKAPSLFWNYREDPRYMKTTNGANGSVVRKRPMYIYFTNLKRQSESSLTQKNIYELRYEGIVSEKGQKGLHYERTLSDGCKLYSAIIRIRQKYHQVTLGIYGIEGRTVEKTEEDIKDYKVYVVVKPNGKTGVFLGDVYRVKRVV